LSTHSDTNNLSVDKPATKTAKSKRSRQVEFASDLKAISPVNQSTNNPNITEAESIRRAKRKRKTEIPTDTASNDESGIVSEGRVVKKRFEESSLTDGLLEKPLENYKFLVGTTHRDNEDNLLYLVTKVYRQRRSGFIVADRVLILSDGSTHTTPDNFPIHIRDVEILTREYEKEKPKPDLRCNLSHFVIDT
jgi:hypothetical protein